MPVFLMGWKVPLPEIRHGLGSELAAKHAKGLTLPFRCRKLRSQLPL